MSATPNYSTPGPNWAQNAPAQPVYGQPSAPQYPQQPAAPQYPQQPAAPQYPQQPAAPQYPQQPAAPQYPQQPAAPQYPQQPAAPQQNWAPPGPAYQQQQYGRPPIVSSLDDRSVVDYAVRTPFLPSKGSQGAEGVLVFRVRSVSQYPGGFNSGPDYRAAIEVHSSTAPGIPAGKTYLITFPQQPRDVTALPAIMGKFRGLICAIEGVNQQDQSFRAEDAKARVLAQSAQGYFDQNQVWLTLRQTCRLSKKGTEISDQEYSRYQA